MGYDLYLLTPLEPRELAKLESDHDDFLLEKSKLIPSVKRFLKANYSDLDFADALNESLGAETGRMPYPEYLRDLGNSHPQVQPLVHSIESCFTYGRSHDILDNPALAISFYFWRSKLDFSKCLVNDDYDTLLAEDFFKDLMSSLPKGMIAKLEKIEGLSKGAKKNVQEILDFMGGRKKTPDVDVSNGKYREGSARTRNRKHRSSSAEVEDSERSVGRIVEKHCSDTKESMILLSGKFVLFNGFD